MKNLRMTLISVFILLTAQILVAQENGSTDEPISFLQLYDTELFQWNYDMSSGLTLNYQNQSSGIAFGINNAMRDALLGFPDSGEEYKLFRRKNITGTALIYGGLAMILAAAFIPLITISDNAEVELRDLRLTFGFLCGGSLSAITGSFVLTSGHRNLFNAVNTFNRNKARELSR